MTGPTVAVIGTGRMGPGIAVAFAVGGCRALVIGRGAAQLRRAEEAFQAALAAQVEHGLLIEGLKLMRRLDGDGTAAPEDT